jgi:glycosyl transferase family 25
MALPLIQVISLEGSPRRAAMATQLDGTGAEWAFFDALRTPPATRSYDPTKARRAHGRALTAGELGCYASHMALWRMAIDGGRPIIAMEDDIIIDPAFFSRLAHFAVAFARYDYLRLYAKVPAGLRREGPFLDRFHVARFAGRPYGTQAYYLSPKGAEKLLRSIDEVVRPIDDELDRYWAHRLPTRMVFPAPVMETDIGTTVEQARRMRDALTPSEKIAWKTTQMVEKGRRHWADMMARLGWG